MATAASSTTRVGRFEVTEDLTHQLGQGTYGTVYRAKDTRDNKLVAAKKQVIFKEYKHLADWEQEAKILRKISPHKNVDKNLTISLQWNSMMMGLLRLPFGCNYGILWTAKPLWVCIQNKVNFLWTSWIFSASKFIWC